ncbi:hypothetical protein B0O99DRAFT_152269 [Bisporella sp. PMI_857]|nr:hypothetical protein B0O99DRAFT_152269 [Bisporella sp. PMI_857]
MNDEQSLDANCFNDQNLMIGNDYSQQTSMRRNSSLVGLSTGKDTMKDYAYHQFNGSDLPSHHSAWSSVRAQQPYQADARFKASKSSTSVYVSNSPISGPIDPFYMMYSTTSTTNNAITKNPWSPGVVRNGGEHYNDYYALPCSHDGLLRREAHQQNSMQQDHGDIWTVECCGATSSWSPQPQLAGSITISPKALMISEPAEPVPSSGSDKEGTLSTSEISIVASSGEDYSSGPASARLLQPVPIRPRQILPNSIPSQRIVHTLPSNDYESNKSSKRRSLKNKSNNNHETRPSTIYSVDGKQQEAITTTTPSKHKRIEPDPMGADSQSWTESLQTHETIQAMHHRDEKDNFLVRSKLAGMSYKDIRQQGGFTEAESTLRGRFRTLTKNKAQRVRKPEWTENDVRLLKKAVRKMMAKSSKSKVPWKQVGEYIANHGGSYHFGNATCRKKWDELQEQSED